MKIVFVLVAGMCCALAQAQSAPTPPVELTAEQDQRRLLDLLHIQSLRPGANPRDANAANAPINFAIEILDDLRTSLIPPHLR